MINKTCLFITQKLVLWVVLCVVLGYFYPSLFIKLQPYNEWFFSLTMFGIGFVLNIEDFVYIFKKFHIVVLGTIAQFLIMPFCGWFVGQIFGFIDNLKLGFIITGSVPGAMASNIISYLAKADVAYSISLTTTSTFLAPILTPFFTYIYASSFIKIEFWKMFLSILKMVVIPVILGLLIKSKLKNKIESFVNIFPALSSLFIAFICGLVVALNKNSLSKSSLIIVAAVALLNFAGLGLGYLAGIIYKLPKSQRRTLSIEVGMQNAGLGAVLSLKHFNPDVAIPSALFATFCVITASILAKVWSKR
ncbi:MAG: bile acid:sodium symporter family protein [Endomicrobia bacterium]|nr:bile acid:sodium symporter family protein [Endomicrobiia bacterium]MCX7716644.1 bile acid:sodium symporter family protein [Endomicrobiia bacterium]